MADSSARKTAAAAAAAAKSRQAALRGGGESNSKKLFRIIVMVLCCVGAGYFFWTTSTLISDNAEALQNASMSQPPDPVAEAEKTEITAAEEGLENLSKSSSQAMRVALGAELLNKYPIDLPSSFVRPAAGPPVAEGLVVEAPPEPPSVTVAAIMVTDGDKVAMLNVEGEEGVLVRVGTKFSEGGSARVSKIDARSVTFIWRKKSYTITL
jgi:hypothetical protein